MRVGTRVEVTYDGCGERWRGLHGTVTETVKWIGLPLIEAPVCAEGEEFRQAGQISMIVNR